jgi:hypothetical protein
MLIFLKKVKMLKILRPIQFAFIGALAAMLAACGGGGGGGGGGGSDNNPPADPLTQYQGTWKSGCEQLTEPSMPTNIRGSYQNILNLTTIAANGIATAQSSDVYYTGGTCSGTFVATVSHPVSLVADGTKTVGDPAVTAYKILLTKPPGTPTFNGPAVSLTPSNPGQPATILVSYGDQETTYQIPTTSTTTKTALSLVSANTFKLGETLLFVDPVDGYPTRFVDGPLGTFTKQ